MQHAEHFLTRLDRLVGREVDLALELYRDPELLRTVVDAASPPEGCERLAISLEDAVTGPFLVVTRGGQFVTCLGRGMRPGELPVVSRPELDACARRVERLREKLALSREIKGQRASQQLLRRLFLTPDSVSREDFLEVAAWEPLAGSAFLDTYTAMGAALVDRGELLRNARVRGPAGDAALREYWDLLHAAGHMALLGSLTADREQYAERTERTAGARAAFSWPLTGTGIIAFILKGAWAAGRLGKLMLPAYKRALTEDVAFFELLDTLFALLTLGLRNRGLRAEIQKALRAAPGLARTPHAQRLREAMGQEIEVCCSIAAELLDATPEGLEAGLLRVGEGYFEAGARPLEDPQQRELARTLPLMSRTDGLTEGYKLAHTLHLVAVAARGGPEQFYLPRTLLAAVREPWKPEDTWKVLDPIMKAERAGRVPAVRKVTVGRNDPCSCGSGKKYKRCCGA